MKQYITLSNYTIIVIQLITILLLVILAFYNLSLFFEEKEINRAINDLKRTSQQLNGIKKSLHNFVRIKNTLIPCKESKKTFYWQDIELHFHDIGFSELIHRLLFLDKLISEKYNRKGLFILSNFESKRVAILSDDNSTQEENHSIRKISYETKPSFSITGRLLCICQ